MTFAEIFKRLTQLEVLDISNSTGIKETAMLLMLDKCKDTLTDLQLSGCVDGVTDAVVCNISNIKQL